jgi:membrane protease YdiL (CAAX protease family)
MESWPMSLNALRWARLPITLRAILSGLVVVGAGTTPWAILFALNSRLAPAIPWSVGAMAIYLAGYWWYLSGGGWPRATSQWRRENLRARRVTSEVWLWSLLAGVVGWFALICGRIFIDAYFELPSGGFPEVSALPLATVLAYVVMASIVAGVVEEAGFRGYLQGQIERRHGAVIAVAVVGVLFALAHLANYGVHMTLFVYHVPFYIGAAAIFGAMVYLSQSILPAIVLHISADLLGFGLLWWADASPETFLGAGGDRSRLAFVSGAACVLLVLPAVALFRRLATVARVA